MMNSNNFIKLNNTTNIILKNISIFKYNRYYCQVTSNDSIKLSLWSKRVLVTGGSRGIGYAIAQRLASNGASVSILSRDADLNKAAVNSLPVITDIDNNLPSNKHSGLVYDLSAASTSSYDDMLKSLQQQNNGNPLEFDIIVHAAGITQNDLFFRAKPDEIRRILEVNLHAPIELTRMLLKPMIRKQWGRIIFLGSVVSDQGNRGQSLYSASKAGLVGFSKSLSREVGHFNITSNVISPGYINTDMSSAYITSQGEALIDRIPLKRIGTVDEVAKAALFLIESNYVTGQVIRVDGGLW